MKRKSQWIGIAALMALAMFMFSACPMGEDTEDEVEKGPVSITIGFAGDITVSGIPAGGITISKSGATKTIVLTASSDYANPVWYVDGSTTEKSSEGNITLNAADYAATKHSVSFTGTKDGTLYSKEIPFTVVD
jgi:hypothetical protein